MQGLVISLSKALMHAKVTRPSQFIAQDPQIPSLHDLLNDKEESKLSLMYKRASKNIGANLAMSR